MGQVYQNSDRCVYLTSRFLVRVSRSSPLVVSAEIEKSVVSAREMESARMVNLISRCIMYLTLRTVVLLFLGLCRPASATEPTLARLSFWVPAEDMATFEATYHEKVVPLLKQHGLVETALPTHTAPDSIFSRFFAFEALPELTEKTTAFLEDPALQQTLQELGTTLGRPDVPVLHRFAFYSGPAGPGKVRPAGPGKSVPAGPGKGHWRTYDESDGGPLVGAVVLSITQDRQGYLWLTGLGFRGAVRYDRQTWKTFTTEDGLVLK